MKRILIGLFILASVSVQAQDKSTKKEAAAKQEIESLIYQYGIALNASNVSEVLDLYTAGGVFMPSGAPTTIGEEQITAAYQSVFNAIDPNLEFTILEVTIISKTSAIVRSESSGTVTIHENGQTISDSNRELFVVEKEKGRWKIARYMFNKTTN